MTIEEAVNVLKCIVIDTEDLSAGVKRTQEKALDFTIKALEKQIPKKPIREPEEPFPDEEGDCPCCKATVYFWDNKYCGCCGQALDWSDSND